MKYVFKLFLVIYCLLLFNNADSQLLYKISNQGTPGFINTKGKPINTPDCQSFGEFHESLSKFKSNNLYGFIDSTGKIVIPAIYERATNFHENLSAVKLNDKWKKTSLSILANCNW